jgi:hypothetical protein
MMNELVSEVAAKTGMSPEQAQSAVTAAVEFLQTRLPQPMGGMLTSLLAGGGTAAADGSAQPAAGGGIAEMIEEGLGGSAMSALGGLFGSKG